MALLPWSCCLRSPTASGTALSRPLCIRSILLVTSSCSIHSYFYLIGWPSSFSSKSAWKHGDLEPRCALTTKDVEEKPRHNRLQILISNPLDRVRGSWAERFHNGWPTWRYLLDKTTITLGVNNMFDHDPPRPNDKLPRLMYDTTSTFTPLRQKAESQANTTRLN